jgi:hypothetical protein
MSNDLSTKTTYTKEQKTGKQTVGTNLERLHWTLLGVAAQKSDKPMVGVQRIGSDQP